MDYDDNLHLAGEGSSKFPLVIQPYAISRFEFEEHLRFDCLVETEVFCGIGSNTDNQWIEDFGRGSSRIEFDSSAADSCSISRRNNVWSEATSSESVEMLLKSVRQEEIIPELTKEADACNDLGRLKKQMEPTLEHDESMLSFMGDALDLKPTSVLGPTTEKPDTNASKYGPSNSKNNTGLVVKVESAAGGNAVTFNTSYVEETSSRGVDVDSDLHIVETCKNDVCSLLPAETNKDKNEDAVNSMEIDGQSIRDANEESLTNVIVDISFGGHLVDASNTGSGLGACPEPNMDSQMQIADGQSIIDKKKFFAGAQQSYGEMLDSNSNVCVLVIEDNKVSEGEFDRSSDSGVGITSSMCMVSSSVELLQGTHLPDTLENVHGIGVSKGDWNDEEHHVLSSSLVGSSERCEEHIDSEHGDVHNCNKNVSVSNLDGKKFSADPSNSNHEIGVSNTDNCAVESVSLGSDGAEFLRTKSSTYPSNYDCWISGPDVISKGVGSSPSGAGSTENIQKLLIKSLATFPGSEVTLENANLALKDTMEGDVLDPGNDCSADVDHKSGENLILSEVKLSHLDRKEETAAEMPKDACSLLIAACSQEETCHCTSSEFEKRASSDTRLLSETGRSSSIIYTCNLDGQGKQAAVAGKICLEGSKEQNDCSVSGEITMEEGGGGTDAVAVEKNGLVIKENNEKGSLRDSGDTVNVKADSSSPSQLSASNSVEGGSNFPASDKDTCGSVPVVKTAKLSQGESGREEKMKGSEDRNTPYEVHDGDAVKSQSAFQNLGENCSSKDGKRPIVEVIDGSSSTPHLSKVKIANDLSRSIRQVSDGAVGHSASKITPGRKPRRASAKATGRETARKRNRVAEASPVKQTEKGDKSNNVSPYPSGIHPVQSSLIPQFGLVKCGNPQSDILSSFNSALPDLNTSLSPTAMFYQPFTDFQQLQLRAQIIIYGSLIQAMAPDEAYMTSAFGGPDGDRSVWENVWRVCVEKSHGKKFSPVNPETPLQSHSAFRAPDIASKQSGLSSKVDSSPVGQTSNSATPSTIVRPVIAHASPLWSITTPSCDALQSRKLPRGEKLDFQRLLSPLHPYQNPMRNSGHNSSWLPQGSIHGPWVSSAQPFAVKHVSPGPMVHSGTSTNISVRTNPIPDTENVTVSSGLTSSDPKSRKRKKNPNTEDTCQISLQPQSRKKPVLSPSANHQFASVVSIAPSGFVFKSTSEEVKSPTPSTDHLKEPNTKQAILSEETLTKVKEARQQAEDAAALAATAICHKEEVWNKLNSRKNSVLTTDVEAKLTSAAVAIAAAVSVAKAAAAAAKVASSAALQAKLMADEAISPSAYGNCSQVDGISLLDSANVLGKASPASILKREDVTNSSNTIIAAAREAARKRVEAASAASRQAENLDALVKAAELAAEAVSHAGKIVSMGDPMLLSKLVGHGPDNYWRVTQASLELVTKSNDVNSSSPRETSKESIMHDHVRDGMLGNTTSTKKDSRGRIGRKVPDSTKPSKLVPEVETGSRLASVTVHNGYAEEVQTPKLIGIKEGSHVEVYKDGDGLKAAWFSANVLSLKDGKAYVGYNGLLDGGSGPLKEWVALGGEEDNAPRIRIACSKANFQFKGTRKRCRAAMGDYNWSIGDKVDACIQDSWREGILTNKNDKDETVLTVHFPAQGETSVVRAWDLRPSLIWRDGDWIEWSREGENGCASDEGDAPQEKRPKLGTPVLVKGKNKMSRNIDDVELRKPEDIRLLDLAVKENVFTIGRSSKDENKPDPLRMVRSGLQKEGSRVIFGVPKPGKQRKFMDVSKHYVADGKSKINEENDSITFSKSFLPQGSRSHGRKYKNKSELKEKHALESKSKVPRCGNLRNVSDRTINQKDNFSSKTISSYRGGTVTDNVTEAKDNGMDNETGKKDQMEFGSFPSNEMAAGGPITFSSFPSSSKKVPISNSKADGANEGKFADATVKLGTIEEEKVLDGLPTKAASEAVEPRRSIRKIQPTSKLLEGLQSSMIISKFPSFSLDRTHKSQNRNASKGNNNG